MIFTDFLKARERKNKYDMISTNFDTKTELSHIVYNTEIRSVLMLSYGVLEAVLMAYFTLVNKTSVINTLVMKDLPKNLYCKNCGKVTPHRPKLDAVINGKLVCNICNIQNDIKP